MKKRTGVIFLVVGFVCLAGAVTAVAIGVMGFMDQLKPVAIVEAPGGTEIRIGEPGVYTLWHDHTTTHGGGAHSNPRDLPPGFTFTLTHLDTGKPASFSAFRSTTTQTMSTTDRESAGLGTFQVTDPGPYKLETSNPAGDQRFISLTRGTIFSSIGSFGAAFVIAALLGLLGVAGLITGLIGVLAGRKTPSAVPTPPPVS